MQMASPGGGSGGGSSAGSTDERRLKRRLSNRESARRTRARKQQELDDLEAEAETLRGRKHRLDAAVRAAARGFAAVEAENAVLRARALELGARLQSLAELLHCSISMPPGLILQHPPFFTEPAATTTSSL